MKSMSRSKRTMLRARAARQPLETPSQPLRCRSLFALAIVPGCVPDESTVLAEIDRNYTAASEHSTFTCDLPLPPCCFRILPSFSPLRG